MLVISNKESLLLTLGNLFRKEYANVLYANLRFVLEFDSDRVVTDRDILDPSRELELMFKFKLLEDKRAIYCSLHGTNLISYVRYDDYDPTTDVFVFESLNPLVKLVNNIKPAIIELNNLECLTLIKEGEINDN